MLKLRASAAPLLNLRPLLPSLLFPPKPPKLLLSRPPRSVSSSAASSPAPHQSLISPHSLIPKPPSLFDDSAIDPYYLSRCMPDKRLRVAVLLSGGVDSSVALRLLHAAGHHCTAFYLKIWFQEDFENFWSECPWEEDLKYAKTVCDQVDVPLEVVHLTDEYWKNVVSYMIEEYQSGRTPNPDVLCNTRIKFGAFMDAISSLEFDYVASGHYANVIHPSADQSDRISILELSNDMVTI
uniref:tRNA-5-taurinomethyluridine 2-sulfurtransferase n=1 Tax=Rhizophora mucronata TaxID=61149 RepID=A0A2P2KQB8_RHIMU